MKHMSKIFALALALVLMLSLATTASAYTISMAPSDSGAGVAGHTYEVYQIYTGTMAEIDGEETLGEVKYGQDYAGKTAGDPVPEEELTEISLLTGPAAADHFKTLIYSSCSTPIAHLVEKAVAPHSSTLAWKIPWTEEPGGLPSMGLHRVGHD